MAEQTTLEAPAVEAAAGDLAGKYLTFLLADEAYALKILSVREIIGLMAITRVPRTPDYVRGVINLRGQVIPVVDLRCKFQMGAAEETRQSCIIVVDVVREGQTAQMGILVDQVSEVRDIAGEQIEPPPSFGTAVDTRFLLGMGKVVDRVVMMLDIERVLSAEEIAIVRQAAA